MFPQEIPRKKKHPDLAYRTNFFIGNSAPPAHQNKSEMTAVVAESDKPKKSMSMGIIPVHVPLQKMALTAPNYKLRDGGLDAADRDLPPRPVPDLIEDKIDENVHEGAEKRKEYKTEYKNRFRPFPDEFVDEFLELRKRAGLYKFRGWGTDLGSANQKESLNAQLWEQVSRRSSLAPLALITTTPRSSAKEEKDKKNTQKRQDRPRAHTATPRHMAMSEKKKDSASASKKAALRKARSQSAGPGGHSRSSPQKTKAALIEKEGIGSGTKVPASDTNPKQGYIRPKSADPAGYSTSEAPAPVKSPVEITQLSNQSALALTPNKVNFEVPFQLILDAPGPGEAQEEIPKEPHVIKNMTKPEKLSKVSSALKKFLYKEK